MRLYFYKVVWKTFKDCTPTSLAHPLQFGKIRLFGSVGWALAMLVMGIGLDYSDTFRNHPCPTSNTTEKNYTLCFVACTIFALAAMAVATQFKFAQGQEDQRPDEVQGLVMDTRLEEVDPAIAQKARGKQLQVGAAFRVPTWTCFLPCPSGEDLFFKNQFTNCP